LDLAVGMRYDKTAEKILNGELYIKLYTIHNKQVKADISSSFNVWLNNKEKISSRSVS